MFYIVSSSVDGKEIRSKRWEGEKRLSGVRKERDEHGMRCIFDPWKGGCKGGGRLECRRSFWLLLS